VVNFEPPWNPARLEQREQHRGQLSRVHRRSNKNMVASQRDDQVGSQIPRMAGQDRLRPRVTMNVYGSARRHLWAQLNISNVEPVRHLDFANRSPRLLVAEARVSRAAKGKECRALMVSRLRHNSTNSPRSGSPVARLPRPIKARPTGSLQVENKKQKNQHPCRGHNSFGATTPAAPRRETPGPLFLEGKL
jgi:hypothetical protein